MRHPVLYGVGSLSLVIILCAASARGAAPGDPDSIIADLTGSDDARARATVDKIRERIAEDPAERPERAQRLAWDADVERLKRDWVPALHKAKRYEQAADLALVGLTSVRGVRHVNTLARQRAFALLAAGDAGRALSAARAYYDACALEPTPAAVEVVAECLAAARPGEPDAVRRFRSEQTDGATTRPYAGAAPAAMVDGRPATRPMGTLASIGRDADADAVIEQALARVPEGPDPWPLLQRGTLLLLLGRPEEARPQYEAAALAVIDTKRGPASGAGVMAEALDGIACCMKAQDGSVGRANAFVLRLQGVSLATDATRP